MKIVVYGKSRCSQCVLTESYLKNAKLPFEHVDVEENPDAAEVVLSSGVMSLPLVRVFDDSITMVSQWGGFQPPRLKALVAQ